MYIKIVNNETTYPYTLQQLKQENPHTTFPAQPNDEALSDFGVYVVQSTPKPTYNYTKNVEEGTPILVDGIYKQNWVETGASQSEINDRIELQWGFIRDTRNQLLQETDWTQLGDIPQSTKDVWTTYRQELRDVTNQSDPFNIVWPVKP